MLGKLGRFLDKSINNLMWGGDAPPPIQPNVAPTLGGGPSGNGSIASAAGAAGAGMAPAAGAEGGGGGSMPPRKGSWFSRNTPSAPSPAGGVDTAAGGSSGAVPAAALPAVGTWAPGVVGAPGPAPAAAPQQQYQQHTWGGVGGIQPSPSPPAPQSLASGHGYAAPSSPGASGSSGLVPHHQRTVSQQSFTAANWGTGLHQLSSFSDASSTNHSRNPSHDSIAAALGFNLTPPPSVGGGGGGIGNEATAAASGKPAAVPPQSQPMTAISGPPAAIGGAGAAGKGVQGSKAAGSSSSSAGASKGAAQKDAGSSGKEGGGWIRSLLGGKTKKVAKLGLENEFYYCQVCMYVYMAVGTEVGPGTRALWCLVVTLCP
jgi:hypothetical protein